MKILTYILIASCVLAVSLAIIGLTAIFAFPATPLAAFFIANIIPALLPWGLIIAKYGAAHALTVATALLWPAMTGLFLICGLGLYALLKTPLKFMPATPPMIRIMFGNSSNTSLESIPITPPSDMDKQQIERFFDLLSERQDLLDSPKRFNPYYAYRIHQITNEIEDVKTNGRSERLANKP